MIAYIQGRILHVNADHLIVLVNDIGYKVFVGSAVLSNLPDAGHISLYTFHHIKEDKNELYGFENIDELNFFAKLISVSGVGPKSALAILSLDSLDKLQSAIASGNYKYLTQVPGVGPKIAKKMILELQDKLDNIDANELDATDEDLKSALLNLGYKASEIKRILKDVDKSGDIESQIKSALLLLSKR